MAENSNISWTTHTWNPWRGCTKVSEGCRNCYADALSKRNPSVLGVWGPNGTRVVAAEAAWREPLKWDKEARVAGERRRVFCASLADVFEDWQGPMTDARGRQLFEDGDEWFAPGSNSFAMSPELTMDHVRRRLLLLIADTPNLDWLLLTKRPQNVTAALRRFGDTTADFYADRVGEAWEDRVWFGTSVENQQAADERIPHLLKVPAAVRFLSMEPLLGPVDLTRLYGHISLNGSVDLCVDGLRGLAAPAWRGRKTNPSGPYSRPVGSKVDWVIVGGESGHGFRPMDPAWADSLRRQCEAATVPFWFKQHSGRRPGADELLGGVRYQALPAEDAA